MSQTLLPPSSSVLERALVEVSAPRHDDSVELIRSLWDPATCPIELLPWLAWALSVDIWDDAWGEEEKRAAVAGSLPWHRKKGTPWAIKKVLASIGFDQSELIEHRALHEAWLTAGGETLSGVGFIDGSGDLSPPHGNFRFTTTSWAEYALRLNVGEQAWVDSRQKEIIAICRAYGPARSHLVAILLSSLHRFDVTVRFGGFSARGKSTFNGCRRFFVPGFDTLDGCDIIGGETVVSRIDGASVLDGSSDLVSHRYFGEPLDGGQMSFSSTARSSFTEPMLGGDRYEEPETLTGGMLIDGRYNIAGPLLDGRDMLDGAGDLFYPMLSTPDDWLDGTSNLGEIKGPSALWFSGMMRVTHGARIYQESMQ